MTRLGKLLFGIALVASLFVFVDTALAIADAPPATPAGPPNLSALWPMIGMVISLGWGYLSRKLGSEQGFFQTAWGHGIITLVGMVIGAVVPVIQAKGFAWVALAWAALGAASSFFGALNPSVTAMNESKLPDKPGSAGAKLAVMLPFALLLGGISLTSGCGTVGGQALAKCELGSLPQSLEVLAVEVAAIASNSAQWQQDLDQLAVKDGPDQLGCVVQAVEASLAGSQTTERQAASAKLRTYLTAHPRKTSRAGLRFALLDARRYLAAGGR